MPIVNELPILNPDELHAVEQIVGRKLTNEEAQLLLREATIIGAFDRWMEQGRGPLR